jgi:hypothetical protein
MLALGIAVNATVFTVTNAVLFKGFPLVEWNDRLRYIGCKTKPSDLLHAERKLLRSALTSAADD